MNAQPQPTAVPAAPAPTLDAIASETSWKAAFEPSDLEEVRALAKSLRGSCAVPMISRGRGPDNRMLPKEPMSEPDIVGLLMLGRSLGLGTMQSLNGIYIVEGRPTLAANTMLALVRRSALCESFDFEASTPERCVVVTRRRGSKPARVEWTLQMAKQAGVFQRQSSPWITYPQAMLRARAISDLCRMVYSDVLLGLYSTEELADGSERIFESVDMPGTLAAVAAAEASRQPTETPAVPALEVWSAKLRDGAAAGKLDAIASQIKPACAAGEISEADRDRLVSLYRELKRTAANGTEASRQPTPAPPSDPASQSPTDRRAFDPATGEVPPEDEPPAREPGED